MISLKQSDTPDDHMVVGLSVEAALLPEWLETLQEVAAPFARRSEVLEQDDGRLFRVEIPKDRASDFKQVLSDAWAEFQAPRD